MRAVLVCLLLTGCATTLPQKVYVQVPVTCVTEMPADAQAKSDQELAKLDDYGFVISLAADRIEYRRYSQEAKAILLACK